MLELDEDEDDAEEDDALEEALLFDEELDEDERFATVGIVCERPRPRMLEAADADEVEAGEAEDALDEVEVEEDADELELDDDDDDDFELDDDDDLELAEEEPDELEPLEADPLDAALLEDDGAFGTTADTASSTALEATLNSADVTPDLPAALISAFAADFTALTLAFVYADQSLLSVFCALDLACETSGDDAASSGSVVVTCTAMATSS